MARAATVALTSLLPIMVAPDEMLCSRDEGCTSMNLYIWRHSKKFSSWSMFDEPHIYRDNYMRAEVSVLAHSREEALEILEADGMWDIKELKRIDPRVVPLEKPAIVNTLVDFG
jgi:hypothetical protein